MRERERERERRTRSPSGEELDSKRYCNGQRALNVNI